MLRCTPPAYWPLILDWLLPPVAGLLSAIVLWVVSRTRSISRDALSTLQDHERLFSQVLERPTRSESRRVARDRKKRSTKGTIST
jgi:cytochrome c-type biogenesis protein CcmH/NrfF